jgi:hypothetical protein
MTVSRLDVRPRLRLRASLAVVTLLMMSGLVAALADRAQFALHACLPGEGAVGGLGVRLALLHGSADCPQGTLALGGSGSRVAVVVVVVVVAVPTLAAHLLAAACGVSLSALLARAASGIRAVLGAVLRALPVAWRTPWVRAALVIAGDRAPARPRVLETADPDRAPPAPLAA